MRRLHWWGWIFFLASSILYLAEGIQDRNWLMTAGSAAFVLGVLLLMTPDRPYSSADDDDRDSEG